MGGDTRTHGSGAKDGNFVDPLMACFGAGAISLCGGTIRSWGLRGGRNGYITHLKHLLKLDRAGE
jgi:hypothetical protein